MTYPQLKEFLTQTMSMSTIYQPLLIESLIDSGGAATIRQLASIFLQHDESQIQYYEGTLKKMPVKILSKHEVVVREGELITLNLKSKLSLKQRSELKRICQEKIQGYIEKRGIGIWDHRMLDQDAPSDSMRNRLLKEANGRCCLCGTTRDICPLDIDHIIPRSKGGKTEYANLQVLCSKCNRTNPNFSKVLLVLGSKLW